MFLLSLFLFFKDPIVPSQVGQVELLPLSTPTAAQKTKTQRKENKCSDSDTPPTLCSMLRELNATQKFSVMTMCWFSMVNFLVLGAWEANMPVFGHLRFNWCESNAGNVTALGGLATMPILFALVFAAKHVQDRLSSSQLDCYLVCSDYVCIYGFARKSSKISSGEIRYANMAQFWFFFHKLVLGGIGL